MEKTMLPVILDTTDLTIAIIGSGPQARRRLQMVDAAGASFVRVFAENAEAQMRDLAGDRLVENWPDAEDLAAVHLVYMANIDAGLQETLTAQARACKTLVNVEDVKPLCDFHVPALVRRGDLLLTVSTGGKSPGLARGLKAKLEDAFPETWAARLDILAEQREKWRAEGADFSELIERTNKLIEAEGWLS
jgi:precorrin-2 dehydrogenase/sirohydrochlorin ferrochelatase